MKDKVYLVYISVDDDAFNSRLKYLIDDVHLYKQQDGVWRGLYGWSYKKKDINAFMDLRNKKVFSIIEKDIVDNKFELLLKNKYGNLKISEHEFISGPNVRRSELYSSDKGLTETQKESLSYIYSTKNEYVSVTEYFDENMFEFLPIPDVDYQFFREGLIEILDILQYTYWYDCHRSEDMVRRDNASYNASFNLTPYGNKLYVNMSDNELYALLYLYSYTFFGNCEEKA